MPRLPRPPSRPLRLVVHLAALLSLSCARGLPRELPSTSPASTSAPEARPSEVVRVLAGDPPLPGEAAAGWAGLAAPTAADAGADVRYVCPMHPDVTSAQPGQCPICGMALERRP